VRREPLEVRKATLASVLRKAKAGVFPPRLQDGTGGDRVEAARLAVPFRPFPDWLKMKNPDAPAVKREAEGGLGQASPVIIDSRSRWKMQWSLGGVPMRIFLIVAYAGLLAGCAATSHEVVDRLGSKYVGQDALVTEWGPPANTFKMNSGDTSYVWQLTSETNVSKSGWTGQVTARSFYCKVNVIASKSGIISKVSTEDSANLAGESLCARRLGMQRST